MTLPIRRRHGRLIDRPLTGWPTMAEFDELFDRFSQLLESAATPAVTRAMAWAPLADMCETESAYVIECELPGVQREDIDVEVGERELTIAGETTERGGERGGEVRRGTRRTGQFEYRATLPSDVRAEEVSASLADGVLTVTVPKAQAARPRHIEVTAPEREAQAGTPLTPGTQGTVPPEGTVRPMS